jgi:hypothetical protein
MVEDGSTYEGNAISRLMCLQVLANVTVRHPLTDQTDGKHGRDTDERDNVRMPEELPHDRLAVKCLRNSQGLL